MAGNNFLCNHYNYLDKLAKTFGKNIKENPTNSSVIINNKEINNNLKNIKNKLKESYQKWQEAKEQFSQELNSQASSTDEINPEILEKIKNKLINQTSTEILEN